MFCSISGQAPEDPVVSAKSGHLFERRLIQKAIQATGRCPITNEPLSVDDLISVKSTAVAGVKPRPVQATSIPGLLALMQNEWDSLMLETFTLKQHLETVRQELSHALYQHDAACRVIARLVKERDEARAALAAAQGAPPAAQPAPATAGPAAAAMETTGAGQGIPDSIIAAITALSKTLSQGRRKRQVSATLASPAEVQAYALVSSHPLHKASQPGITCVDVHRSVDLIATGGVDAQGVLFNWGTGKVTGTLQGHTKRVNDIAFVPNRDMLVTASADRTARVWGADTRTLATVAHTAELSSVACHPSGDYLVTAAADGSWAFHDIGTGLTRVRIETPSQAARGLRSARFHPDGLILGTGGADGVVRVWDINKQQEVAKFEGHAGEVAALAFSENGYYMAAAAGAEVKLWDLRKLNNVQTLALDGTAASVAFDYSGAYLAVGSTDVRLTPLGSIYQVKTWQLLKQLTDHTATVTGVSFAADARYLATSSMDRNMMVFAPAAAEGSDMQ